MLSSHERGNINKRLKVLKLIFNIEDSLVKLIKNYYSKNKNPILSFISADKTKENFIEMLEYRANKNSAIKSTFNKNDFMIYDFLEIASLGDLIAMIDYAKPGLKALIKPAKINFKLTKILYSNLTLLRNKVSHSSLKPIDGHIYELPMIHNSLVGEEQDIKKQYTIVIRKILEHFKSSITNFDF